MKTVKTFATILCLAGLSLGATQSAAVEAPTLPAVPSIHAIIDTFDPYASVSCAALIKHRVGQGATQPVPAAAFAQVTIAIYARERYAENPVAWYGRLAADSNELAFWTDVLLIGCTRWQDLSVAQAAERVAVNRHVIR